MDLDTILRTQRVSPGSYERRDAQGRLEFAYSDPSELAPDPRPLEIQGNALEKAAATERNRLYDINLTDSYALPYQSGPLPSVEKLSADPKWWTLYKANPDKANEIHTKLAGEPFDVAYKRQQETKDFLTKTIRSKWQQGDLRQNDLGDWEEQQSVSDPDDPTGKQVKKWVPLSSQFQEALFKVGGARALGLTDRRDALEAMPPSQRLKAMGKTDAEIAQILTAAKASRAQVPVAEIPMESEGSYTAEGLPGMLRRFPAYASRAVGAIQADAPRRNVLLEAPAMAGHQASNILNKIIGGRVTPLSERPDTRTPTDLRHEIDLMRLRKGLPEMTDEMWHNFQDGVMRGKRVLQ